MIEKLTPQIYNEIMSQIPNNEMLMRKINEIIEVVNSLTNKTNKEEEGEL